jgi:hypothetical protein
MDSFVLGLSEKGLERLHANYMSRRKNSNLFGFGNSSLALLRTVLNGWNLLEGEDFIVFLEAELR